MNADQETKLKSWRRLLWGILYVSGAMGGLFFAASAILMLTLGSGTTVTECFVLLPFIVGGLALSVIPKWRKPRIIVGIAVSISLAACFLAALLSPGIS